MPSAPRQALDLLKTAFGEFNRDDCTRMAAALSYYTVFSLPPLLILLLFLAGHVFDPKQVQHALETQIGGLIGSAGADQIRIILENTRLPSARNPMNAVLGGLTLLLGATGAFIELQSDLNLAWEVKPDPKQGGLRSFLLQRVFSFGVVLAIAFLLLVSLAISAALSALGGYVGTLLPGGSTLLLELANTLIAFVVIAALFAGMFKLLPDAVITWRDAGVGALVTAFLFTLGKFLIGFYLGQSNPGSAFGAAGSLAIVFAWVYYSALILFFGAEFTQVWAERQGRPIVPKKGAVRIVNAEHEVHGAEAVKARPKVPPSASGSR